MKTRDEVKEQLSLLCQSDAHKVIVNSVIDYIYDEIVDLPNYIEYSREGLGCGLEDRNITDRYEAAAYGFEKAVEQLNELVRE